MGKRASTTASKTPASNMLAEPPGVVIDESLSDEIERMKGVISAELPEELQPPALGLLRAVSAKVAVAEHFDAFCGQAFSKPEWAAVASPVVAEIFEQHEDQLAELARIPDLIIEMSSGEVNVTCMVASRWAARGETHRLSRLADSLVASHASKSACAVDVMLALAATLAVTRFSRAEQLYQAALPLTGEEHQEALADARLWLAAGRVVCSCSQEDRDFWDIRLRKPKAAWSWQSPHELRALDGISERLGAGVEAADLFRAIVPPCWWDLAQKCARQQEALAEVSTMASAVGKDMPTNAPKVHVSEPAAASEPAVRRLPNYPRASPAARFVLGWVCGAIVTALTLVGGLSPDHLSRVQSIMFNRPAHESSIHPVSLTDKEVWRRQNVERVSAELAAFADLKKAARSGTWEENEKLLSGQSAELPFDSLDYLKLLAWLHLSPPEDNEVRKRLPRLLLMRSRSGALGLWEELIYPGSVNADEIRHAAREALVDSTLEWTAEEKQRLHAIVGEVASH